MASKMILTTALLASLGAALPTATLKDVPSRTLKERAVSQSVTNSLAVTTVTDEDGVGAGTSTYTYYTGDGSTSAGWPAVSQWASFDDLFSANEDIMLNSCGWNDWGDSENDSSSEVTDIRSAIESVAASSYVDHRFILAIMMQESEGCVRVPTTSNGVTNPGLMQDHDGTYSCNSDGDIQDPCPTNEITGMIEDGTGGTSSGDGLAALINEAVATYGASGAQGFYFAARLYNSGSVDTSNLDDAEGATACYVSDVANRLMGWTPLDSDSGCTA